MRENTQTISPYGQRLTAPADGISVTGEAVRRASPDAAEFLIEISASATTAAQALRDHQTRSSQIAQSLTQLGVQPADLETISVNIYSMYRPLVPAMPQLAAVSSEGQFNPFELQYGAYNARSAVRVHVRDKARVGEVVDAAARSGATIVGAFAMRMSDDASARKAALEAAGRDARAKAESMAAALGKTLGEPVAIAEEMIVSNGTYMALRAAMPLAFGAAAPQSAGELEFYARVSARFSFQ